jgi:hypothetical protein
MRIDVGTGRPAPLGALVGVPSTRRRIDRFELAVLGAFAAVSVWVLALDLWQVVVNGRVWTGTDGVYIVDQMQYLAWIRSASHHLFASNLFVLRSTPADYFQPAVVISGGLAAIGVSPPLSLLIWKPIAVVAAFFAVREYAYRTLDGLWSRRVAIVLGLFFGSFTVVYGSFSVIGDMFPGFLSWGYEFGLLALAAMVWALLAYDRARTVNRIAWAPGLLGALSSLLHPWHGELLIVVVIGAELIALPWRRPTRRTLALLTFTVALTALPLLYYVLLGKLDLSWRLARVASKHEFSLWSIVLALMPLLLPALLAYRRRPVDFLASVNRSWPIAAFAVFVVSATGLSATPLHAFQGITIPLAVLAVEGVRQLDWRRVRYRGVLAGLAVFAITVPATAYELDNARQLASPTTDNANFIERDERAALDYLQDEHTPGGVLTRSYLGAIVPEKTGRRTLVGDCLWSQPHCYDRVNAAQALFDGTLSPKLARRFVRRTGATFVLADCSTRANLARVLAPMLDSIERFGCATVYLIDAPGQSEGPLAESRTDAALRAPRRK